MVVVQKDLGKFPHPAFETRSNLQLCDIAETAVHCRPGSADDRALFTSMHLFTWNVRSTIKTAQKCIFWMRSSGFGCPTKNGAVRTKHNKTHRTNWAKQGTPTTGHPQSCTVKNRPNDSECFEQPKPRKRKKNYFIPNLGEKSSSKKELNCSGAMYFPPFFLGLNKTIYVTFHINFLPVDHIPAKNCNHPPLLRTWRNFDVGSKNRYSHLCKPDFWCENQK